MKKCPGCERELDRMNIICEYCGRLEKAHSEKTKKINPIKNKEKTVPTSRK